MDAGAFVRSADGDPLGSAAECCVLSADGFIFATKAASANRGLIDLAMSSAVVPLGTSLALPSGRVTWIVLFSVADIDNLVHSRFGPCSLNL